MRLSAVTLEDFGCFTHARLSDLPDGLTVVAGPQRAGKTTFMQAIRQLPYGIDRGDLDSLPPADDRHRLAAEFEFDGRPYTVTIDGQADPHVAGQDGPGLDPDDITGNVTKRQYAQLFTVSLAQLRAMPDGIEDEEDLTEVLLGGAFGDVGAVPAARDEFTAAAEAIAGVNGDPSYRIKEPHRTIEEGVADRREARATVDEYRERRGELAELEATFESLGDRKETLEREKKRLSLFAASFEEYRTYRRLDRELSEDEGAAAEVPPDAAEEAASVRASLTEATDELEAATSELEAATDADDVDALQAALLDRAEAVEEFERRVEAWRQRAADLRETETELEATRRDIERRVARLHDSFDGQLSAVRRVETDLVDRGRLRAATAAVETLEADLSDARDELARKRDRAERLEAELEAETERLEARDGGVPRSLKLGAAGTAAALVVGAGVSTVTSPLAGFVVAAVLAVVGFALAASAGDSAADADVSAAEQLRGQLAGVRADVEGQAEAVDEYERRLAAAEEELAEIRDGLNLPEDVDPATVREFYETVLELRSDADELETAEERLAERRREFAGTLDGVVETLAPVVDVDWDPGSPLADAEAVYGAVARASEALPAARRRRDAQRELRAVLAEASELLASWQGGDAERVDRETAPDLLAEYEAAARAAGERAERRDRRDEVAERLRHRFDSADARRSFAPLFDREELSGADWVLEACRRLADEYATVDAVKRRVDEVDDELDDVAERRDRLRDERADLERDLESLRSDEDIRAAEAQIQRGRDRLEPLYEEYAVNRFAAYLLDELHDEYLAEVTGPLLESASEIFAEITDEYVGVSNAGSLDALEFRALEEGAEPLETGALSRATAEQLFLALRLAKLRELDVSLPVVFDDAMTNFDPEHTRRTLAFVDRLAADRQVFLLTCHPELLALADEHADVAQYRVLDDGQFGDPVDREAAVAALATAPDGG